MIQSIPSISIQDIKFLCGTTSFQRGQAYHKGRRVTRLQYDPAKKQYEAIVKGSESYEVYAVIDDDDVEAECNCPAFDRYYNYCKHIAAVLLQIHETHRSGDMAALFRPLQKQNVQMAPVVSSRDIQLSRNLIALFDHEPVADVRHLHPPALRETEPLNVLFICKMFSQSYRSVRLTIEMKVGNKRLYVVQKIKDFLSKISNRHEYPFTKQFTYDPAVHFFKSADWEMVEILLEVIQNESIYRETFGIYSSGYMNNERALFIPPQLWEKIAPVLKRVAVQFEHGPEIYEEIEITDENVPFTFHLNKAGDKGYELDLRGLDRITIMENYGYLFAEGKLYRVSPVQLNKLAGLKGLFQYETRRQVIVPLEQMDKLMERVIPGLKQVGQVKMAAQISEQIVDEPLATKLYLDRDDDILLARLEYVYGDITVDPFQGDSNHKDRANDRLLMRDVEQEQKIMNLLEMSAFKYNGSVMYMDQEESIYYFLYHYLPQLEKVAEIFVTPALRPVMQQNFPSPKVSMDVDAQTEWLEVRFDMEGIDEREVRHILQSIVEKKKYYRLPNGSYVSLEEEGFAEIGKLMEEMGIRKSEVKGSRIELPVVRGFHLIEANEKMQSVKLGKSLRGLLDNMRNPDQLDFHIPESLKPVLRDYQKYGFQWLKTLAHYRFGGILADDMGLGKTLQSIAYLLSEQEEATVAANPAMIVAPASLIYNWRNELHKFAPQLRVEVVAGDRQERSGRLDEISGVDVLITSYPLLRRDIELYADRRFRALFLDEAQAIKNNATQTAQAVRQIQADRRFALTGTPIENTLEELWSIFDAVFPDLFTGKKAFNQLSREQVARKVRPFILRRLKTDVLKELPEKIETLQTSELTSEQKKLYMAYLTRLQQETAEQLQADGFHKSRMKILAGLTRLRQLCCHPALFVENYQGDSGKLEQLLDIVDECRSSGKRMLIFSQFTEMLSIIRKEFDARGLSYFYLDGQTPSAERVELCQQFNEGNQAAFLISLRAGGTGLNLTGADTVILYDLWWNPAVEQQAADRAHRIGQKKVVQVIRLVTHGTIEEKMYELQQRKKDLIEEVIQPGQEALSSLTEKEIRELLMI